MSRSEKFGCQIREADELMSIVSVARKALGLSRYALAKETAVDPETIRRCENGKNISWRKLHRILTALCIEVHVVVRTLETPNGQSKGATSEHQA